MGLFLITRELKQIYAFMRGTLVESAHQRGICWETIYML